MRDADFAGRAECLTCGIRLPWQEMDAGHYMGRSKMATRWDPLNVHPQCRVCNRIEGGKREIFARELDFKFGDQTAMSLRAKSNRLAVYSNEWIEEKIRIYNEKIRDLS